MISQILVGSVLMVATIVVTVLFIELAMLFFRHRSAALFKEAGFITFAGVLTASALWLLLALAVSMWIWAGGFYVIGAFSTLEESLYFAMASFTTLGFGDILLPHEWRLLSGFAAANGLMLFGLNAALLMDVMMRMRRSRLERGEGH